MESSYNVLKFIRISVGCDHKTRRLLFIPVSNMLEHELKAPRFAGEM